MKSIFTKIFFINKKVAALNSFIEKFGLQVFLVLLGVAIFTIFNDFIFFNKLYLFKDIGSDSININYPCEYHIAYYMHHISFIPKWSFNQGMGQNVFPFCFPDPFYFVLYLFGSSNLAYGLAYMEITKLICAGLFFYLFLKKISLSNFTAIIGGILYSFAAIIILGGCWNIFSTQAVYFALLLYSFEKLYQNNNIIFFPITISLIAINQPFDLFLFGLFLLIYLTFRLVENNERDIRKIVYLIFKLVGLGILGIAMSSFFFINNIIQMLDSPRVGGDASYANKLLSYPIFGFEGVQHNLTALLRFFSSDLLGTGANFTGWQNYLEAPLFYCGLLTLLLFPQIFVSLDRRKKIVYFVFLSIFLLLIIFPFFRYAYWLFSGNYYRVLSLIISFALMLFSLKAIHLLSTRGKISLKLLGITIIVLLVLLFYPYNYYPISIVESLRNKIGFFIILYGILICFISLPTTRNIAGIVLLIVMIAETINFSNSTINNRPVITGKENKQKIGYNDYSVDAVDFLKKSDKSFYRINKDYASGLAMHESMNDAKVQDFYGTPSYYSFNQINYIKFLQELEIIQGAEESQTRWAPGISEVPLLHSFASVKYALSKSDSPYLLNFNYESIAKVGDVTILENKFSLPLGFTYDKYIRLKDFEKISQEKKIAYLYKAFVIDEDLYQEMKPFNALALTKPTRDYTWEEYETDVNLLKATTMDITVHDQNFIKGTIKTDRDKMLFFSIPYDKGWEAKVDGNVVKTMKINIGFTGILLASGYHSIELSYCPPYFMTSALISLMAIALFISILLLKKRRVQVKLVIPG